METEAPQSPQSPATSERPQTSESPGLIGLLAWAETHKKNLAMAAGAAIVLIAAAAIFVQQQARKEITASEALSDVRISFNPSVPAPSGAADALLKVASDYRGTKAAARALLISAGILYSERNYDEASKRYTRLIQEYPNSTWIPEANLGVAASLDAQGRTNDAIAKFEDIRKRFAGTPSAEEAKLGVARLYEAQKHEEAYKLYEEISKGNPGTSMAAEAEFRREELERKHPELAKLKEPIVPPQPIITPATNRVINMTGNVSRATNVQTITIPGSSTPGQAPQIQVTPTPATPPTPAPAPAGTPPSAATPPAPAATPVPPTPVPSAPPAAPATPPTSPPTAPPPTAPK